MSPARKKAEDETGASKPAAEPAKKGRKTLGGPELKMPSFRRPSMGSGIKAPAPVAGVVGDLRERGLLPVVLVLIAAIVAVPLLLSDGKTAPAVKDPALAGAAAAPGAQASVVVSSQSGVRDYKKRLDGDAEDPFVQPESAAPAEDQGVSADPGAGVSASVGASADSGSSGSGSASGGTSTSTDGSAAPSGDSGRVWLTHTVDLYAGSADAKKLQLRRGLMSGEVLPNSKNRLVAFTGVPNGTPGQAWFVLSGDVELVDNEGKCALGSSRCEVVALKVGDHFKVRDFEGRTYVVKLASIDRKLVSSTPK